MEIGNMSFVIAPISDSKAFYDQLNKEVASLQRQNLDVEIQYNHSAVGYTAL